MAGIIDFGFMFYSRITVINAAREGARGAVTAIDSPTSIPGLVGSSVSSVATGLVSADLSNTAIVRRAGAGQLRFRCRRAAGPAAG